jgi:hypothetical protein
MDLSLRTFLREFVGVVLASLVPVIAVAFLSVPLALGGHPGEQRSATATVWQHMT